MYCETYKEFLKTDFEDKEDAAQTERPTKAEINGIDSFDPKYPYRDFVEIPEPEWCFSVIYDAVELLKTQYEQCIPAGYRELVKLVVNNPGNDVRPGFGQIGWKYIPKN